ncbi:NAD(P)H-binding protein [Erythrobacter sp. MTPC3]|uniref:NAD(P)H-binding protein n=1 Tax=Erythrobacter sp. MTPC3 TaxID=3056564 RepID=UPI0036F266AA
MAGASGTIGRATAAALLADGHAVTCILRDSASGRAAAESLEKAGANVFLSELSDGLQIGDIDTVVSCIASRSGSPKDALAVDYQANANLLGAAVAGGAQHFVLLSAICVQKPQLAFQHAKLAFEAELIASAIDHTIVRPTAYFKSLSGQVARVAKGKAFLLFGNGELTRCKPISDRDLARFVADCVSGSASRNQVLPIGGPGPAISLREQGELIFAKAGLEPKFRSISPAMFDAAARLLSIGAPFSGWFAEKAEYARIAKYYATQSMLVFDSQTGTYRDELTPEFGEDTLGEHYETLLADLDEGDRP